LCVWFRNLYAAAGLQRCSSHSGRRTFITNLARVANKFGNSLVDIQLLAGHSDLKTTQAYIEPSASTAEMIASLGSDEFDEDGEELAPKKRKRRRRGDADVSDEELPPKKRKRRRRGDGDDSDQEIA